MKNLLHFCCCCCCRNFKITAYVHKKNVLNTAIFLLDLMGSVRRTLYTFKTAQKVADKSSALRPDGVFQQLDGELFKTAAHERRGECKSLAGLLCFSCFKEKKKIITMIMSEVICRAGVYRVDVQAVVFLGRGGTLRFSGTVSKKKRKKRKSFLAVCASLY